jgi:GTPase SAR1 family protein
LTVQFVDGHFVESYYPTIENTFSKVIRYKNQEYATEIIDTAGQVRRAPRSRCTCTPTAPDGPC